MIPKVQTLQIDLSSFGFLQLNDVVLLSLIRGGIDNGLELVKASGIARRTVYRRLVVLTGAGQYWKGKVLSIGHVALVASRPHPHQQGKQLVLTDAGTELLQGVKVVVAIKTQLKENIKHTKK